MRAAYAAFSYSVSGSTRFNRREELNWVLLLFNTDSGTEHCPVAHGSVVAVSAMI